ncbi:MAG: hypothetical protein AUF64_00290 [Chloroflexi bacterium 13_1_20CM_54_36]|nr:MAG: hypothetical protein AUF64_00290 [Chloroflexi bacterium 13_1_20CM_54_36]OLE51864.1 MAG: hypothetical protein AUG51_20810 [Acidobacteria bacterium 13_1_20CM_3_53_8]
MNATQLAAREKYIQDIQRYIKVDEDKVGNLICIVPSKSNPEGLDDGAWHTVHCEDKTSVPYTYHCSCESFEYRRVECPHMKAVNAMYARIYKSNIVKRDAKIFVEAEEVKAKAAKHNTPEALDKSCNKELRETKVLKANNKGSTDLAGKGALNGATQSAEFWGSLPSRQKVL